MPNSIHCVRTYLSSKSGRYLQSFVRKVVKAINGQGYRFLQFASFDEGLPDDARQGPTHRSLFSRSADRKPTSRYSKRDGISRAQRQKDGSVCQICFSNVAHLNSNSGSEVLSCCAFRLASTAIGSNLSIQSVRLSHRAYFLIMGRSHVRGSSSVLCPDACQAVVSPLFGKRDWTTS